MVVREFEDSFDILKFSEVFCKEVCISWNPPDEGGAKCNVDGACRNNSESVGCSGVIQNHEGS